MLMAQTLDGKIAKHADHFPDWTGAEDKKLFVEKSKKAGAVMMGSRTFDTIGRPLPGRKNIILSRNKSRVSEWDNLIYTDEKPTEILKNLEEDGYSEVILAGGALVNSLFAKENLIDEIIVTVSPLVFGEGLALFEDHIAIDLELKEAKTLENSLVCLTYRVQK